MEPLKRLGSDPEAKTWLDNVKNHIKALYDGVVRSLRKSPTTETCRVTPRTHHSSSQFLCPQVVNEIATSGTTFKDKNALLTGIGRARLELKLSKASLVGRSCRHHHFALQLQNG